jgi:RNA polymerase sigma-70 factor (sigma-E family)
MTGNLSARSCIDLHVTIAKAERMVNDAGNSPPGGVAFGATAFEDVYRGAYDRMTRVAHMLTGHNDIAEEVVQDAFVGLYRRFDTVSDPHGYLYRSVVNGCRQRHRRRQVGERLRTLRVVTEVAPPEIDETWRALEQLSPRRRAAVVLRYYADLSEADIAEALGCSRGTVKSLLHRALAQLKDVIDR